MVSKTGRILVACVSCTISLALPATAQESTYSADSLMAAFERGPKASPKGAEISLRGVVAENKNSKLIFWSSLSNRVICELAASAAPQSNLPAVGSLVTVMGKVRGRGLLGNVTLDNCSLALSEASTAPAEPVPSARASASPDAVLKNDSTAAPLPKLPEAPGKSEAPGKPEEPGKGIETRTVPPAKPRAAKVKQEAVPSTEVEHQDQTTNSSSEPRTDAGYRFYALLVLGGAFGYALLAKVLGSAVRAMRNSRPASAVNTPQVRQAALEALLLKGSKDKFNQGGGRFR